MRTGTISLTAHAAGPELAGRPESMSANGRPAAATYRALLTARFDHHGKAASGFLCQCGAPRPCDEERHIALLLEMDVGDEAWSGPPPPGEVVTRAWPRRSQLTGPTASNGSVSTERRTGGVTRPAAGPAATPDRRR
jgi:hypothetical protein